MLIVDGCRIRSGGGIVHAAELYKKLSEEKHDAVFYVSKELAVELESLNGKLPVFQVGRSNLIQSLFWQRFKLPKIVNSYENSVLLTLDCANVCNSKNRIAIHQDISVFMPKLWFLKSSIKQQIRQIFLFFLNIYTFKRSKLVIFQSEFARKITQRYFDCPSVVIPHGVNAWFEDYENKKIVKNKNNLKISCVSPIFSYKDYPTVIKACKILERYFHVDLKICGSLEDQKEYKKIKKLINKLSLNSKIVFLGHVNQDEIEYEVSSSDVMIFSSLSETFGITLLECMQSNTPVLSSSFEVSTKILNNPNTVYEMKDPVDLAFLIKRVVDNKSLSASIVEHQKIRAKDFSWDLSMSKHLCVINKQNFTDKV